MKKFVSGLLCGVCISLTTAAFASDMIQTHLFPVHYYLNGEPKALSGELLTLNHNGRAYVPLRWVSENLNSKVHYEDTEKRIYISTSDLTSIPDHYPRDVAQKNGDVIYHNSKDISNFQSFEGFLTKVKQGENDWVRVVRYTDEGDPSMKQLVYDGTHIRYQSDNTRDRYGDRILPEVYCTGIVGESNEDYSLFTYVLQGCEGDEATIPIMKITK